MEIVGLVLFPIGVLAEYRPRRTLLCRNPTRPPHAPLTAISILGISSLVDFGSAFNVQSRELERDTGSLSLFFFVWDRESENKLAQFFSLPIMLNVHDYLQSQREKEVSSSSVSSLSPSSSSSVVFLSSVSTSSLDCFSRDVCMQQDVGEEKQETIKRNNVANHQQQQQERRR